MTIEKRSIVRCVYEKEATRIIKYGIPFPVDGQDNTFRNLLKGDERWSTRGALVWLRVGVDTKRQRDSVLKKFYPVNDII